MAKKLKVVIAGGFPKPGTMQGTYGRILNNIITNPVFQDDIEFIPFSFSLPDGSGLARRWVGDLSGISRTLAKRPEVLHLIMHHGKAFLREYPSFQVARLLGVGTVMDIRAGTLSHWMKKFQGSALGPAFNHLYRSVDEIVVECPKHMELIREKFHRESVLLPNIMPERDFRRIAPADLGLQPGQPLKLIYSGRYIKEKGILTMLAALDLLAARGRPVEFHFTGAGPDPELNQAIATWAANPKGGVRVIDHGWDVGDLLGLLRTAHVAVMLSSWFGEGHPNSLTESMTAGLASILNDWPHRQSVIPKEGHLVVPPDSPEAFARAVETYLDDPAALQRAGAANRAFVEQHFLDSICYPRLLETWKRAAARRR